MLHNRFQRYLILLLAALLIWVIPFTTTVSAKEFSKDLIIVNKKTNKLAFFQAGKLVKVFSVATGKSQSLTPEGTFDIVSKIKNRPYYKEKIPGGDPRNPLGDRWLGLDVNGTMGTTYAIHGNNNKNSIGKYVSAGCIRMYNDDIHWLFPQIEMNTKVIITSSKLSFEEIAEKHGYPVGWQKFEGTVVINGKKADLKDELIIVDSRIYVPLRATFEILGGEVSWNNKTAMVTVHIGGRTITHKALANQAEVNGKKVSMAPSLYRGDRLMLPLRSISEMSGFQVEWDSSINTVNISSQ